MPRYTDLRDDTERLRKIIVDDMLKKIAFRHFEEDRGTAVHKVLPDKSDNYEFSASVFEGYVEPDERRFCNATYDGSPITTARLVSEPEKYYGIGSELCSLWWDTFGESRHMSSQPSHPGEPTIQADQVNDIIESIDEKRSIVVADPMMEDLVQAVQDKNYRIAAQFLNLDVEPMSLFTPSGEHELTELFTNGEIHIIHQERDIALLKPEYNHGLQEEILNQQRSDWGRVRLQGEQPEIAFVVGIDDTPTGLFVHSVDGTRLDEHQDISREYLHDVMGFDYNFQKQENLSADIGDRIRLQGDFAVERIDENGIESANRCNLPIDNHLAMLTNGKLAQGEDKESEPVTVQVPEFTTLNIMHDEHDNVCTELQKGTYRFYLLERGLKPPQDRPNWPEP